MYLQHDLLLMKIKHSNLFSSEVKGFISVLYIEPNQRIQKLIKSNIEKEHTDIHIITAKNSVEGFKLLDERRFDCIICEYDISDMNGLEFLDEIRHKEIDIPFILFADRCSNKIVRKVINNKSSDYIDKELNNKQYALLANRITNQVSEYMNSKKLHQKRQQLNTEQEFINASINSINDIFYVLDYSGKIIKLNKSGKRFIKNTTNYDYNKDDLFIKDIFPDEQKEQIDKSILSTKDGNDVRVNIESYLKKDNSKIELDLTFSLLNNSHTERIVGVGRDVTKQNKYKRQLKYKNKQLTEFAKIISHDIRNPLSIAQGYIDMIEDGGNNNQPIQKTKNALNKIENILDDVLDISTKTESDLTKQYLTIDSIANNCWNNIENENSNLYVKTNQSIFVNEKLVYRFFDNMFKNSIKHGGKNVDITIGSLNNGFYIEDTGDGIPDKIKSEIFNPNYTTSNTGKGLGLTIVEHVCDLHNWTIKVTESSSGGARFEITDI